MRIALRWSVGARRDPVSLRLHPDDLGMGVLGDLADQGVAVALGHPVRGLDLLLGVDQIVWKRSSGVMIEILTNERSFVSW